MKIIKPQITLLWITPNAEKIIEKAGKVCYKSEASITEDSSTKFIESIIKRGHGCYDEKTEVLTKDGFKLWKNISSSDQLAIFSKERKLVGFEVPKRFIKNFYSGEMYLFDTNQISLKITPDHNILFSKKRKISNFILAQANSKTNTKNQYNNKILIETPLRMTKVAEGTELNNSLNVLFNDDSLNTSRLVGFFLADGTLGSTNTIIFNLKRTRKINFLKKICKKLDLPLKQKNNKFTIFYPSIKNKFSYFYENKEKIIPKQYFITNEKNIEALIEGLIEGDGHKSKSGISFSNTSYSLISDLQALLGLVGKAYNIYKNKRTFPRKDLYMIYECSRKKYPYLNDSRNKNSKFKKEFYKGNIYCAEVTNNILMVRRNNKIVLSGNSVLEHASASFLLICDRGVMAELTRHRTGISFSVESTRYCDYSKDKFNKELTVIDPCFWTDDYNSLLKLQWKNAILFAEQTYNKMIELGAKAEEARSILPNSLKTEIVVTANIREWLHIIKLRTSKQAHPQIIEIINLVKEVLKKECPNIFSEV